MANKRPQTLQAMRRIFGVGAVKLERYGQAFLDVIIKHNAPRKEPPSTPTSSPPALAKPTLQSDTTSSTTETATMTTDVQDDPLGDTLNLLYAGYTPERAAQALGVSVKTVRRHGLLLVKRGHVTPQEATGLTRKDIAAIEEAIFALAEQGSASPKRVREHLEGRFEVDDIACVYAALEE
jgi:hypothetical protein